ncbi:EAL domain-containing protein [Pediococcus siamensis]|uniref:EAL domain-containing protein n=1 Tax=Pediococcus siamensis TaxID=381829 RepID=UPI0039A31847
MLRFWGQPQFYRKSLDPVGYELFLREGFTDNWNIPTDFGKFTVDQISGLLIRTVPMLPKSIHNISLNLDIDQFVDPEYQRVLLKVKRQIGHVRLAIELTEHASDTAIPNIQLLASARTFAHGHLHVILDGVGSGENQLDRVELLNPFVHEYKFAVQNFRPHSNLKEILPSLTFWHTLAHKNHKLFTIEGIESKEDLLILSDYQADMLQGYDLGRPIYLPTLDDPMNDQLEFNYSF